MLTLEEYIERANVAHGHTCAGQILGIRLSLLGLKELGIDDPIKERKRLITIVEIDRCATDAVQLVTGCRLGKRALKFKDFGKVAATFMDLKTGRAIRIVAREEAKQKARQMLPGLDKEEGQRRAYRQLSDEDLFTRQWVRVALPEEDMPGYRAPRVVCAQCGEGINFKREVQRDGRLLCRACAGERYYEPLDG